MSSEQRAVSQLVTRKAKGWKILENFQEDPSKFERILALSQFDILEFNFVEFFWVVFVLSAFLLREERQLQDWQTGRPTL